MSEMFYAGDFHRGSQQWRILFLVDVSGKLILIDFLIIDFLNKIVECSFLLGKKEHQLRCSISSDAVGT